LVTTRSKINLSRASIGDPFLLQLTLGPFLSVQAQLGSPRRIAAHFDVQRTEVVIIDVEVSQGDNTRDGCRDRGSGVGVERIALDELKVVLFYKNHLQDELFCGNLYANGWVASREDPTGCVAIVLLTEGLGMTTWNVQLPLLLKWEFFNRCQLPILMPMTASLLH
jgi:hypothetical protein